MFFRNGILPDVAAPNPLRLTWPGQTSIVAKNCGHEAKT
jgi:hypothetical protein